MNPYEGTIRTVSEQIYQVIRSDILEHRRIPGEKLTTKELQEQLGVSSTPIREALTKLIEDGLVSYTPNIGMSVVSLSESDIAAVFDFMAELDVIAMRYAYQKSGRGPLLEELRGICAESAACISAPNLSKWLRLSDEFHLVFYRYAKNEYLRLTAERLRLKITLFSNQYQQDDTTRRQIQGEHEQMLALLEQDDLAGAVSALYAHLAQSRDLAILHFAKS